ncbi:fungal zn(2)-Cys(6) binuclear cluster domain-containing protein [Pochonia chlamydosporia 170]|uniref:Fungal zn(2)-Cys(6) binuclear cluster domain-containing protein n=1 Tax=Pochonia chlamydosporia 170 TaxID=1380566 RepID=A0A179FZE3_METCM|nr:fungal zn(2)-Cys(6) binuclear cluster domain-containing protein [Pochonia chlamydosporia 170]OAQ70982.1 fungal zn(2)-Cys(6) binuclear cluster domain-containing protein [Pochonia chlamydosporia 170]
MLQTGIPLGRPISACRRCRKFKVGCDRAKPSCSRCTKAKVDCIYVSPPSSPSAVSTVMRVGHVSNTLQNHPVGHDGVYIDEASPSKHTRERATQAKPNEASLQNLSLYASSLRLGHDPPSVDLVGSGKQVGKLTRDRAILSCMRCRRHKVRCDRQIPCGRCIKNKRESQCVYSETAAPVLGRIISEKHHETLNLIATSFIDSKWAATVRNGAHWNSLLYEVPRRTQPRQS